jgi:hypothetical protein
MNPMHHTARVLISYLQGPPKLTQFEFADRAHIHRSKVCRIMQNDITVDRQDLDGMLEAIPDQDIRRQLVMAYIRDHCSPGALLHLKTNAANEWEGFDVSGLTPQDKADLRSALKGPHAAAFRAVVRNWVKATGD